MSDDRTLPLRMIADELADIAASLDAPLDAHVAALADQVRTHAGYVPSARDHEMIHWAKARRDVRIGNGDVVKIIAWRTKAHRSMALVQRKPNGAKFNVPVDSVARCCPHGFTDLDGSCVSLCAGR